MDSPLCSLCAGSHSARWTLTFQASQPSLRNQAWLSLLRHVPLSWDISLYFRLYRFSRRFSRCLENFFEKFWWKVGLFLVTFSILTVLLPLCPHPPRRPCPFRVFCPEKRDLFPFLHKTSGIRISCFRSVSGGTKKQRNAEPLPLPVLGLFRNYRAVRYASAPSTVDSSMSTALGSPVS